MIVRDSRMLKLTPEEWASRQKALERLGWHLRNMLITMGATLDNHYLLDVYVDVCCALLREFARPVLQVVEQGPGPRESVELEEPDYDGAVARMLRSLYGIDYEILSKTTLRGIATGNGDFELPGGDENGRADAREGG